MNSLQKKRMDASDRGNKASLATQSKLIDYYTRYKIPEFYQNLFISYIKGISRDQAELLMLQEIKSVSQIGSYVQYFMKNMAEKEKTENHLRLFLGYKVNEDQEQTTIRIICQLIGKLRGINFKCTHFLQKIREKYQQNISIQYSSEKYFFNSFAIRIDSFRKELLKSVLSRYVEWQPAYDPFFMNLKQKEYSNNRKCNQHIKELLDFTVDESYKLLKMKKVLLEWTYMKTKNLTKDKTLQKFGLPELKMQNKYVAYQNLKGELHSKQNASFLSKQPAEKDKRNDYIIMRQDKVKDESLPKKYYGAEPDMNHTRYNKFLYQGLGEPTKSFQRIQMQRELKAKFQNQDLNYKLVTLNDNKGYASPSRRQNEIVIGRIKRFRISEKSRMERSNTQNIERQDSRDSRMLYSQDKSDKRSYSLNYGPIHNSNRYNTIFHQDDNYQSPKGYQQRKYNNAKSRQEASSPIIKSINNSRLISRPVLSIEISPQKISYVRVEGNSQGRKNQNQKLKEAQESGKKYNQQQRQKSQPRKVEKIREEYNRVKSQIDKRGQQNDSKSNYKDNNHQNKDKIKQSNKDEAMQPIINNRNQKLKSEKYKPVIQEDNSKKNNFVNSSNPPNQKKNNEQSKNLKQPVVSSKNVPSNSNSNINKNSQKQSNYSQPQKVNSIQKKVEYPQNKGAKENPIKVQSRAQDPSKIAKKNDDDEEQQSEIQKTKQKQKSPIIEKQTNENPNQKGSSTIQKSSISPNQNQEQLANSVGNSKISQITNKSGKDEKRQIKLKVGKFTYESLKEYIDQYEFHSKYEKSFNIEKIMKEVQIQQTYVTQFLINGEPGALALCCISSSKNVIIKLWGIQKNQDINLTGPLFKKYADYVQKLVTNQSIFFKGLELPQVMKAGFVIKKQGVYQRKRTNDARQIELQFQQCFMLQCSQIKFVQKQKEDMLFSAEIQNFTTKNSKVTNYLLSMNKQQVQPKLMKNTAIVNNLTDLIALNKFLDKQNFDTYEVNSQLNIQNINLSLFNYLSQFLYIFVASDGYLKFNGDLIKRQGGKIICGVLFSKYNGKVYFSKGYDSIEELGKDLKLESQGKIAFWVPMFNKRLYGRYKNMKQESEVCYGNWDISLFWQDEMQGVVKHPKRSGLSFGGQNFFVSIQVQGNLVYMFEVNKSDFIF